MSIRALVAVAAVTATLLTAGCTADAPRQVAASVAVNPLNQNLITCLADAGFETTETWDGAVTPAASLPLAQQQPFAAAGQACAEKLGLIDFRLTDAQLSQLYAQELESRACLIAEGREVEEPPSEQTFIDEYYVEFWGAWSRSDALELTKESEAKALAAACPPPSWWLQLDGL